MDGSQNIIPPSVDTDSFRNNEENTRLKDNDILTVLEAGDANSGLENLTSNNGEGLKLLYSGPLTEDRFPYRSVLNALKQTSSKILVIGRPTNQGAGREKIEEIVSYARRLGIENRVSAALKLLNEDEKIRMLNYSDVVIQPFARNTQLYVAVDPPIFLLEAMACGRPVITSKSYSFQSLIKNGYNGYTIDWDNPDELNHVLSDCLASSATRSLGKSARETVLRDFSYLSVSKKIGVMYDDYN
jgi:glycosyltransferase involved in cell wall biosynthesis